MIEVSLKRSGELEKLANGGLKNIVSEVMKKTGLETEAECKKQIGDWTVRRTGNLVRSPNLRNVSESGFELWGAYYWKYLNDGTSRISPRPFVTNTAKKVPKFFDRNVKEKLGNI